MNVNVANDQRTSRGQARRLFYARTSCPLIALRWMDLSGMSMDDIKKSRKGHSPIIFFSYDWVLQLVQRVSCYKSLRPAASRRTHATRRYKNRSHGHVITSRVVQSCKSPFGAFWGVQNSFASFHFWRSPCRAFVMSLG